jgi:hypothetical protein
MKEIRKESGNKILIKSDNTVTCYCINRARGSAKINPIIYRILSLMENLDIELEAQHIKGEENNIPDALSRFSRAGDY